MTSMADKSIALTAPIICGQRPTAIRICTNTSTVQATIHTVSYCTILTEGNYGDDY